MKGDELRNGFNNVVSSGSICYSCVAARSCWNSKGRRKAKKSSYYRDWFVPFLCKNLTLVAENFEIEEEHKYFTKILIPNVAIQKSSDPLVLLTGFENLGHMHLDIRNDLGKPKPGRPLRVFGLVYEYVHREEYDPIRNIGILPVRFDQELPYGAVLCFIWISIISMVLYKTCPSVPVCSEKAVS